MTGIRTKKLHGQKLTFNPDMQSCQLGAMFGFIKEHDGVIEITNRVFETRLYNYYLSENQLNDALYLAAGRDKRQFFKDGMLDMDFVIRKFVTHYREIYGDNDQKTDQSTIEKVKISWWDIWNVIIWIKDIC